MGKDMCGSTGIGNTVSGFFFFLKKEDLLILEERTIFSQNFSLCLYLSKLFYYFSYIQFTPIQEYYLPSASLPVLTE